MYAPDLPCWQSSQQQMCSSNPRVQGKPCDHVGSWLSQTLEWGEYQDNKGMNQTNANYELGSYLRFSFYDCALIGFLGWFNDAMHPHHVSSDGLGLHVVLNEKGKNWTLQWHTMTLNNLHIQQIRIIRPYRYWTPNTKPITNREIIMKP